MVDQSAGVINENLKTGNNFALKQDERPLSASNKRLQMTADKYSKSKNRRNTGLIFQSFSRNNLEIETE